MPNDTRTIPIGTPPVRGRVVGGIEAAIADPAIRPQAHIRLRASGGAHGEKYEFDYRIDAAGRVQKHLLDELKGRRHQVSGMVAESADPRRFAMLARSHDIESLMGADMTPEASRPAELTQRQVDDLARGQHAGIARLLHAARVQPQADVKK